MEKVVESVRVPCANAAYGCTERPAYHDQHRHLQTCAHAPCRRCPDAEPCGFVASTTKLWGVSLAAADCNAIAPSRRTP
ncbi:hypothetical protein PR202_gb24848 [Eleusine coracana subsp. coracana]|uniref:SIAH-type domain-containing protein n=1 Tax=Eleusine coracana subsp. coracana TaxID=191504 RepID=A0AAV5FNI0_ELECO|nr:hypothetical protein PR202_gb24848 [Eleusine coracana subsp. coracana]